MKNLRRLCFIIVLICSWTLFGQTGAQCRQSVAENPELIEKVESYREKHIEIKNKTFQIRGVEYKVIGLLGESSSPVYLAVDPNGRKVSIKHIQSGSEDTWAFSAKYEEAATRFYREQGFPVPEIYAVEFFKQIGRPTQAFIVKEYRLGLTAYELEMLSYGTDPYWKALYSIEKLNLAIQAHKRYHKKFANWLNRSQVDIDSWGFQNRDLLIANGDIHKDNFLFDVRTQEWILFDP